MNYQRILHHCHIVLKIIQNIYDEFWIFKIFSGLKNEVNCFMSLIITFAAPHVLFFFFAIFIFYFFQILKFHLQCLYSKDREIRVQALSHVVHRLAAEITVFVPDPREFHLMTHQDLLINSQPIHLLLKGRISTEVC